MRASRALNVSQLPKSERDYRSLVWWGNALLLVIETTVFGLLVASYFYVRMNFSNWPPNQPNHFVPGASVHPSLLASGITATVLLISFVPMFCADRAALAMKKTPVVIGLIFSILLGFVIWFLRFWELRSLPFIWDDNAYASIFWTLLGMHWLHITIGTCENIIMLAWLCCHPLDLKHARDVRVNATYWYWIVAIWIPLYIILYVGPRIQ